MYTDEERKKRVEEFDPIAKDLIWIMLEIVDSISMIKGSRIQGKVPCFRCRTNDRYTFRYYDDEGNWTGKYICKNCHNKIKTDCRNRNLDPLSTVGKGFIGEMIIAKYLGLKNCNLELDNFNARFDISPDSGYKRIQVKTPSLIGGKWKATIGKTHNFDTVFIVCMDKNEPWKDIKRMYIVPEEELHNDIQIDIYDDWPKIRRAKFEWIEKYRVVG